MWAHEDALIVYLMIDGEQIVTTPEHPFYTVDNEWVAAGALQAGDDVWQADRETGMVGSIMLAHEPQVMYNLTVTSAHTFFVGGQQWLVHNNCHRLVNGMTLSTDEALDTADHFLGPGYVDMGNGRYLSADGLHQVRIGDGDILGHHAGGRHMNFETREFNSRTGRWAIVNNVHVYLED